MEIFDGHADLLWEVARCRMEGEGQPLARHRRKLAAGQIRGLGLSLWTTAQPGSFWPRHWDGWQRTAYMMAAAREALAQCPWLRQVRRGAEARAALAAGETFAFLTVEGMAPIGEDLGRIDQYAAWGVRMATLTWNEENQLAGGSGGPPDRGLTDLGRAAVGRMQALGILPDVSHASEGTFWDVLKLAQGPVAASHSNCRSLCDVPRNLTDDQLLAIRDTGGVVGLNSYHRFVHREERCQTAAQLSRHAAYMAEVMGPEHVACGFDFCGYLGSGSKSCRGLEDAEAAGSFFYELERAGFSERERRGIALDNWLRVLT